MEVVKIQVACPDCRVGAIITGLASTTHEFVAREKEAWLAQAGCVHAKARLDEKSSGLLREMRR